MEDRRDDDTSSETEEALGRDLRNLVRAADEGELRAADFRDAEIATVLEHLDKRRSVLLVGPPGVGKTTVVHGVARAMSARGHGRLFETSTIGLFAGTRWLGEWQTKVTRIADSIAELGASLFVTDIVNFANAGSTVQSNQTVLDALRPPRLVLGLVLAAGCTAAPMRPPPQPYAVPHWESKLGVDHPLSGVILDVARGRRVSEAELVARVQAASIVLVGEIHDNPDHHRLQAHLLQAFAATHDAPAVVFEMLDRNKQPAVDASLAAHPGDADALAKAVAWESSGWPPWSMYRPVFEAALAAHAAILAAGIDRNDAMRIAHEGVAAFDPGLVPMFGLDVPLPPDEQASMRREMRDVHCGLLPESMLDSMVLVQRARDALLAERLHEGEGRRRGALLIAGAGHVRRDRGVPAQLARAYGARALAIGLVPVSTQDTTPESYAAGFDAAALPFDFVWFTPRTDDVDRCAEMRAHVGTAKP